MKPPPRLQHRLDALADAPVNYDPDAIDMDDPPSGWAVDDRRVALPPEPPGEPEPDGSFQIACRLIRGYEFADPSLVRAYYDPDAPLQGRDMLLELRALGLVSVHVGVRVCVVWEDTVEDDAGRRARRFGWAYRTLQGHVEQGQMGWEVRKRLDSGEVEFRTHAVSRTAPISNPVIWLGFHVLKRYERRIYLNSTLTRMRTLTGRALRAESPAEAVRASSPELTARGGADADESHDRLADRLERRSGG